MSKHRHRDVTPPLPIPRLDATSVATPAEEATKHFEVDEVSFTHSMRDGAAWPWYRSMEEYLNGKHADGWKLHSCQSTTHYSTLVFVWEFAL